MSAFTTIARAFKGGLAEKPARGYLIPLDVFKGDEPMLALRRSFQYFPGTVQDHQGTNYQNKIIPGLSHPLYQWTSGNERIISFETIFTRDRTYTDSERAGIGGDERNFNAAYAASSYRGIASSNDPRNVDIPSAVAWLRSFLLPEYSTDGQGTFSDTPQRPRPPMKMILGLPGVRLNWGVPSLPAYEMYVIMKVCDVLYDGFFHDGTPRTAKVGLAFAEIIQVGGTIIVQDGATKRSIALGGYTLNEGGSKGT